MSNLHLSENRTALDETILWCSRQSFSPDQLESEETLHRRELIREAGGLLQRAGHGRDALESPDWRRAINILTEADPDSLAPLQDQLRSPQLKPRNALGEDITEAERQQIVTEVISRRSKLLASDRTIEIGHVYPEELGRLLIYYPAEHVADGASRYASKGFYDPFDAPPWDLWVLHEQGELLSWVPAILIPLAQEGIDANPVDCIRWADSAFILKPL
jgi:hypothetical protein